jgi:HEAT repeat protein
MGVQRVEAQRIDSNRAVQRYNRVAKGSNIAEWHRRLFDEDPTVRLEAVESLGEQGSEECVKPLLDATADSDPRVRAKAFDYLGAIGSRTATQVLTQYLFLTDVDRSSKQRILVALGRIGDPAAVRPLHDFLQKSEDAELRCGALYALGEIGDPKSLEILEEYAQSPMPHEARIAHDAEAKINARVAQAPNTQPTLLQLEKLLGPRNGEEGP